VKKRYELTDALGRYLTAEYDEDKGLLMVTTYLHPKPDVPIEEALRESGFIITSEMTVEKPQLVSLKPKGD
jgi:hypothetical protein